MISVIIPIYNGEEFIEDTYRQLAAQTERDFELLYVDDGSLDKSGERIAALAAEDDRIRYFRKENGGIASARNYGLDRARGEYVCFVDQDDFVKPDMLAVMLADIKTTGADLVKAGTNTWTDGMEGAVHTEQESVLVSSAAGERNFYLQSLILRGISPHPKYHITVSVWSCLFCTDFLRKHNIRFYRYCDYEDDWIFCIQAFLAAERFCLEKKTLYSWRIHGRSESHNRIKKDRYLEGLYENHKKMETFLLEAVEEIGLTDAQKEDFRRELQKQRLLWVLSNETGRGIDRHTLKESSRLVKQAVAAERRRGLCKSLNRCPLSISGYGTTGIKRQYHLLRDRLLTFLLLHHMEALAVLLNKKLLHGRWHI
ncbi:MAG: glycosyltransferase family 2 protein [Roseburia sp.]